MMGRCPADVSSRVYSAFHMNWAYGLIIMMKIYDTINDLWLYRCQSIPQKFCSFHHPLLYRAGTGME